MRSLVKHGIWGSGLDTLLGELRHVIQVDGADKFPLEQLEARMKARGKGLTFSPEEIEDLLDSKYGGKRTFAVLALLFPHVDTRNIHHVDHVYPHSLLGPKKLKALAMPDSDINQLGTLRDQLPNLELLEGPVNVGKSDTPPLAWATNAYSTDGFDAYLDRNALPGLPADALEFVAWFGDRREALKTRLAKVLGVSAEPDTSASSATHAG
jgi:hypothetical protein